MKRVRSLQSSSSEVGEFIQEIMKLYDSADNGERAELVAALAGDLFMNEFVRVAMLAKA